MPLDMFLKLSRSAGGRDALSYSGGRHHLTKRCVHPPMRLAHYAAFALVFGCLVLLLEAVQRHPVADFVSDEGPMKQQPSTRPRLTRPLLQPIEEAQEELLKQRLQPNLLAPCSLEPGNLSEGLRCCLTGFVKLTARTKSNLGGRTECYVGRFDSASDAMQFQDIVVHHCAQPVPLPQPSGLCTFVGSLRNSTAPEVCASCFDAKAQRTAFSGGLALWRRWPGTSAFGSIQDGPIPSPLPSPRLQHHKR